MNNKKLTANIMGFAATAMGLLSILFTFLLPIIKIPAKLLEQSGNLSIYGIEIKSSYSIANFISLYSKLKELASKVGEKISLSSFFEELKADEGISINYKLIIVGFICFLVMILIAAVFAALPMKPLKFVSTGFFFVAAIMEAVLIIVANAKLNNALKQDEDALEFFKSMGLSLFSFLGIAFWLVLALLVVGAVLALMSGVFMPGKSAAVAPPVAGMAGLITFLGGNCAGYQIPIYEGEEVLIGKDPRVCSVCIDKSYTKVSRKHCGVKYDSMQDIYIVTDYSTNGTNVVGGSKLGQYMPSYLQRGTVLNLAKTENSFRLD